MTAPLDALSTELVPHHLPAHQHDQSQDRCGDPHENVLDALALDLDGRLVRPGDPDWDTARQAWHLEVDQRPTAVVQAASARDVVLTVDTARRHGLRVAAQSTGHNAAPLGDLAGTVLLRTGAMRSVTVDPVARLARVEAGAWWQDVTQAAAPHGLAALAGSSPDVGVAGYVLGGGLSWLARSHGLASNSITALEVVTADGRRRRVDTVHDADLFWALRGGGGSFAIVTAIELRLYPITHVQAGVLFFGLDRAEEVLRAWRAWLPSLPESVTSVGRILRFPPIPDLPPHLSGRSYVVVEVTSQNDEATTDAMLAPLRALAPELDTVRRTPITELSQLHMDPLGPTPGFGDGMLLDDACDPDVTGDALLAAFVEVSHRCGPALLSLELRHLGGAVARLPAHGGAVAHLPGRYALFAVGITPTPEVLAVVKDAVREVQRTMRPWSTGRAYLNFAERETGGDALFGSTTHQRLRAVKTAYDPHDVLRSNHPVRPLP